MKSKWHILYVCALVLGLSSCSNKLSLLGGKRLSGGGAILGNLGDAGPSGTLASTIADTDTINNINYYDDTVKSKVIGDVCGDSNLDNEFTIADCNAAQATQVLAGLVALGVDDDGYNPYQDIEDAAANSGGGGSALIVGALAESSGVNDISMSGYTPVEFKVDNYCSPAPEAGLDAPTVGYISSTSITMANGQTYLICELLNLRDGLKQEVERNVQLGIIVGKNENYDITQHPEYNEFILKRARREFVFISVNTVLSFATDFIGLLQYLGLDLSDNSEIVSILGDDLTRLNTEIYNKRMQIRTVDENKVYFENQKRNVYTFVEQFWSDGIVISTQPETIITYEVNTQNLCKYLSGSNDTSSADFNACLTEATRFLDKFDITHQLTGDKSIHITFTNSAITTPLTLMELQYDLNYKSFVEFGLPNVKSIAVAYAEEDLQEGGMLSQQGLDQATIDLVKNTTFQGAVGFGSQILDMGTTKVVDGSQVLIDRLEKSSLPAKLHFDITENLLIVLPDDLSAAAIYEMATSGSAAGTDLNAGTDDVYLSMSAAEDVLKLRHQRGNNLYQDTLGINASDIVYQMPPYKFDAKDFLIFDLTLDEFNDDFRIQKPTELISTINSKFEYHKYNVLEADVKLSDLDINVEFTRSETCDVNYNEIDGDGIDNDNNYIIDDVLTCTQKLDDSRITFAPWELDFTVQTASLPTAVTSSLTDSFGAMDYANMYSNMNFKSLTGNAFDTTTNGLCYDNTPQDISLLGSIGLGDLMGDGNHVVIDINPAIDLLAVTDPATGLRATCLGDAYKQGLVNLVKAQNPGDAAIIDQLAGTSP